MSWTQQQLSIFDIEITEKTKKVTKIDEKVTEKAVCVTKIINKITPEEIGKTANPLELTKDQQKFLDKNKLMENGNLTRIILHLKGSIMVEIKELDMFTAHYINTEGKEEFIYKNKAIVMPWDKIIYCSLEFEKIPLTEVQENKLQRLLNERKDIKTVIHRKGDENILIEIPGRIIDITPIGWELPFETIKHVECTEDEVYLIPKKVAEKVEKINSNDIQKIIKVGDYVQVDNGKEIIEGKLFSEYNAGHTFNIIFDNETKHTAIPRIAILKILKSA